MKYIILLLSTIFSFNTILIAQNREHYWNQEIRNQHFLNMQDSTTWDLRLLEQDKSTDSAPFKYGAFPVPKYDLLKGTYAGIGMQTNVIKYGNTNKHLIYPTLFVNRNKLNEAYIGDKQNEAFFVLVVLSDVEIDTTNYTHARGHMISRNNPDNIGQGYIKTKEGEIDYMAFITADRDEFAIVNMRLFNLKYGRIILISPQKDGTLRSLQMQTKDILSSEEVDDYISNIIKERKVKYFFAQ